MRLTFAAVKRYLDNILHSVIAFFHSGGVLSKSANKAKMFRINTAISTFNPNAIASLRVRGN